MEEWFLLAQCIGFLAMCFSVMAQQMKKPRHIIMCFIPGGSLWTIQYLLLQAPIGALMNFLAVLKDTGLVAVKTSLVPYVIGLFLLAVWGAGLYFFVHWYDILPIIAGTIINLALTQRDNRPLIARSCIISNILWLIYNCIVGSWMGALCAILVSTSAVIGMARYEQWQLGICYRTFVPSIVRSLLSLPTFRTYP